MKKRSVVVIVAVLVGIIVAEWKIAAGWGASSAIHDYHGICNGGVGDPYTDFIHQLRTIAENGDTNRLVAVLRRADERSRDIYDVWLGDGLPKYHDAYRKSIDEILK